MNSALRVYIWMTWTRYRSCSGFFSSSSEDEALSPSCSSFSAATAESARQKGRLRVECSMIVPEGTVLGHSQPDNSARALVKCGQRRLGDSVCLPKQTGSGGMSCDHLATARAGATWCSPWHKRHQRPVVVEVMCSIEGAPPAAPPSYVSRSASSWPASSYSENPKGSHGTHAHKRARRHSRVRVTGL